MTQVGNPWRQSIHLAKDRLTEDSTSGTDAHVYTYTFDSRDNILSSSETGSVVTRSYDAASRLVSSSDGSTYTFDANGNLTEVDDVKSEFEYDKENRLIFYSSNSNPGVDTTMVYNAFGQKKRETNPDLDTLFIWDGDDYFGFADAANDSENAFKIFIGDGGTMLGEFDPADSQSRMDYMVDFLGSVTGQTNKKGDLGSERRFKPFGELLSGEPVKALNFAWTGNTGSMHTGMLYSEQYNRARHYSTTTNIWTTRDPLWPSEHPFGYVGGNPVTNWDPLGLMRNSPCPPPPRPSKPLNCANSASRKEWNRYIYAYCNCVKSDRGRIECDRLARDYYVRCKGRPGAGKFSPPPGPFPGPGEVTPWPNVDPVRKCPDPSPSPRVRDRGVRGEPPMCGVFVKTKLTLETCVCSCYRTCPTEHLPGTNSPSVLYDQRSQDDCTTWCRNNLPLTTGVLPCDRFGRPIN